MALIPTINVCSKTGCSAITITDTAGAYHVSLNPTGWAIGVADAGPNISPLDTGFIATIAVTTNGTTTTTDVSSQVPEIVSGDFTYSDIDVDLTDGWVTIVYTLTTDATTVSITKKIFVYCDIKCCVFTKMALMKDLDPCKDTAELLKYLHMWNLYKTMIFEANGCNANEASNTLARLQALCNIDADCGCS